MHKCFLTPFRPSSASNASFWRLLFYILPSAYCLIDNSSTTFALSSWLLLLWRPKLNLGVPSVPNKKYEDNTVSWRWDSKSAHLALNSGQASKHEAGTFAALCCIVHHIVEKAPTWIHIWGCTLLANHGFPGWVPKKLLFVGLVRHKHACVSANMLS